MIKTKVDHTFAACMVTGKYAENLPLQDISLWGRIFQGPVLKNFHRQHTCFTIKITG